MEAVSHIAYLCTQRHYPMYNGSLIYEQQDGETLNTFPRVTVLPALVGFFFGSLEVLPGYWPPGCKEAIAPTQKP